MITETLTFLQSYGDEQSADRTGEENGLLVLLSPAPDEASQRYLTTLVRKEVDAALATAWDASFSCAFFFFLVVLFVTLCRRPTPPPQHIVVDATPVRTDAVVRKEEV